MACGAAEIDETSACKKDDAVPIWEDVFVNLRFDVFNFDARIGIQFGDFDFVVEMADVADDGMVFHHGHVFGFDDVAVARTRDNKIHFVCYIFQQNDFQSSHSGLQRADWIRFRHDDVGTKPAKSFNATFADVAISADKTE